MYTREEMNVELKQSLVPVLRELGFNGSLPHFYRERADHVDLLCVQFSKYGGSFVVELSFAGPDRDNVCKYDKDKPPKKLRVYQTYRRLRLGAEQEGYDYWFAFDDTPLTGITGTPAELAVKVVSLLRSKGVLWWKARRDDDVTSDD